jgi:hypothetical protein
MAENTKPDNEKATPSEHDGPVKIDLDPEVALKALLQVEPESERAQARDKTP